MMQLTGWAIIHSLWEGGLIAVIVAGAFSVMRGARPQTRYAVSLVALVLMVVLPVATGLRSVRADAAPSLMGDTKDTKEKPKDTKNSTTDGGTAGKAYVGFDVQAPIVETASPLTSQVGATIKERLDPAIPWVVFLWMIGLSLASIRLIGGYARTRAIRASRSSNEVSAIEVRVRELAARLGISQIVRAIESTTVDVPLVVGALRPLIVVPSSLLTGLTPNQLDMLLAHELAHIRRHDYLVNLFQTVVETLLFYHPAVRWVSERAREERENCCDDVAIALCNVNPNEYTSTLLVLEESRGQNLGFATAASGGSLLRRAVRLLTGQTPRVELGPLWFAGLLTISAALFTGREAYADIRSSYVPVSFFASDSTKKSDKTKDPNKNPDPSRAAPSEVVKAPAGTLDERWKWAERSRGGTFWIGYLIGDNGSGSRYYASDIPVRLDGNVSMSGHMRMDNTSGVIFSGTPQRNYFGEHQPGATAIFFKSVPGLTGRHIERVRYASYALPAYFDKLPVVWLDSATDAESVGKIRSILAQSGDEHMRRDLVSTLGAHKDESLTTPVLVGLMESREVEGVRREAADALGQSRDPRAMTALARVARADNSEGVRREATEAIGNMDRPAATDTLIRFVREFGDEMLRRTAIEALGNRNDPKVLPFLTSLVRSNAESRIRETALESLVNSASEKDAAAVVIDIAKNDTDSRMRRNAIEMIPKVIEQRQAVSVLREIVYSNDGDESVKSQAVETIGNVTSDVSLISQIARTHPSERVRRQALEEIPKIATSKVAIELLVSVAKADPSQSVRTQALEGLVEGGDPAGMKAVVSIIRGNDNLDVRMRALDVFAESANPADAVALIKTVLASDDAFDMRYRAVQKLEDVGDGAGVPVLRQVAQSNPDARLRDKAARILNDR